MKIKKLFKLSLLLCTSLFISGNLFATKLKPETTNDATELSDELVANQMLTENNLSNKDLENLLKLLNDKNITFENLMQMLELLTNNSIEIDPNNEEHKKKKVAKLIQEKEKGRFENIINLLLIIKLNQANPAPEEALVILQRNTQIIKELKVFIENLQKALEAKIQEIIGKPSWIKRSLKFAVKFIWKGVLPLTSIYFILDHCGISIIDLIRKII